MPWFETLSKKDVYVTTNKLWWRNLIVHNDLFAPVEVELSIQSPSEPDRLSTGQTVRLCCNRPAKCGC